MIGYVKGRLLNATDGVALIENNGIGYEITCSASVYAKLLSDGGGEVYTYMAVRDDDVSLFGFVNAEEKNMFLKLVSVSGVGPKMGIAVLSEMSLDDLTFKIATGDAKGLSKVKGLGKKTAERIILELREKVGALNVDADGVIVSPEIKQSFPQDEEAIAALTGLGFTRGECERALATAHAEGITQLEKLIAFALKNIK